MYEYLLEDEISHVDMLDPLTRGTGELLYDDRDGVILRDRLSGVYLASMEDAEKCLFILSRYPVAVCAAHQEETAKALQKQHRFREYHPCFQYVYPHAEFTADAVKQAEVDGGQLLNVRLLGREYLEVVNEHYDAMDDPGYIEELMGRRQLWGILEDGDLAGFIGQHLEGSMGLLEVLPRYRKRGYGKVLEVFLIRSFLAQNRRPFCQVFEGNEASERLQRRLGMVRSEKKTWWLF